MIPIDEGFKKRAIITGILLVITLIGLFFSDGGTQKNILTHFDQYADNFETKIDTPQAEVISRTNAILIGESGNEWQFELRDNDLVTEIQASRIEDDIIELFIFNKTTPTPNYRWFIEFCMNTTEIELIESLGNRTILSEESDRCSDYENHRFLVVSNLRPNQFPILFRIRIPQGIDAFELRAGNGTRTLIGTSVASAPTTSLNEKFVKDSGNNKHFFYTDNGNDAHYWNLSSNNVTVGANVDVFAGTSTTLNLEINTTDGLQAFWTEAGVDIRYARRNSNSTFQSSHIVFDGTATSSTAFNFISTKIDGNNTVHYCVITDAFNTSANNEWLIYGNWSQTQSPQFWSDGSVRNGTRIFNGTLVSTSNLGAECDIEIDKGNNVFISYTTSSTNTTIFSSKNRFSSGFQVQMGNAINDYSMTYDPYADQLILASRLGAGQLDIWNASTSLWNSSWTGYTIHTIALTSNVKAFNGTIVIVGDNSTNPKHVLVRNSTQYPRSSADWTNNSVLIPKSATTNNPQPILRGSTFPSFNQFWLGEIDAIYHNQSASTFYFVQFNISFPVQEGTPPGPSDAIGCAWISNQDVICNCSTNNGTSGLNVNVNRINLTGNGSIIIRDSNVTYTGIDTFFTSTRACYFRVAGNTRFTKR